jgi:hypothetical protein
MSYNDPEELSLAEAMGLGKSLAMGSPDCAFQQAVIVLAAEVEKLNAALLKNVRDAMGDNFVEELASQLESAILIQLLTKNRAELGIGKCAAEAAKRPSMN